MGQNKAQDQQLLKQAFEHMQDNTAGVYDDD